MRSPAYKTLVTQLYFKGDPMNAKDQFIKSSLIIPLAAETGDSGSYERGTFDIVLARGLSSHARYRVLETPAAVLHEIAPPRR